MLGGVFMMTNSATSDDPKLRAFRDCKSASVRDAWRRIESRVLEAWHHDQSGVGLERLGSETQQDALTIFACGLLKAMFGNNFRRKSAEIIFLRFKQGSREGFNQHFHALMAIEGDHDWSDQQIAEAICEIDRKRSKRHWEKDVHVDWNWINDNRFHSYVAREAAFNADSVWVM